MSLGVLGGDGAVRHTITGVAGDWSRLQREPRESFTLGVILRWATFA